MRGFVAQLAALILLCILPAAFGAVQQYNTTAAREEGKLNVHIVCHTHDDVGWLKTVDQYYYGANNSIQVAGVQYILDTVVEGLQKDPNRKFVYAEMAFFRRWWNEQPEETQDVVKQLVERGQLEFINGGEVQHDEAAAHYVSMIDQTTRGHRFLKETFGAVPRVGWQIDPFGHSSTHASLLAASVGFDALFFGRADYQDMDLRKKAKQLEFVWRGAKSFGESADIFTGNFYSGNYGPPPGFNWDWGSGDEVIQDDPCLMDYNVERRIDDFVTRIAEQMNATRGRDVMLTMGSDFQWANARVWYKNLDKLIHYVNKDGRLNAFYSTPRAYAEAKSRYDAEWPLKADDFFPYADCKVCYWTGYFTSRPNSKGYIRAASSYLQAARQLQFLSGLTAPRHLAAVGKLEAAVALTQHHDSITGTEKQHVTNDYHIHVAKGWESASQVVKASLGRLLSNAAEGDSDASSALGSAVGAQQKLSMPGRRLASSVLREAGGSERPLESIKLEECRLLNASICAASVSATRSGRGFSLLLYNPLAWGRTEPVRVPIAGDEGNGAAWVLTDSAGLEIEAQIVPVSEATAFLQSELERWGAVPNLDAAGSAELVFLAELPPLGFATYNVEPADNQSARMLAAASTVQNFNCTAPSPGGLEEAAEQPLVLDTGKLQLSFSTGSGQMTGMSSGDLQLPVRGSVVIYNGSDADGGGDGYGTPSGAYIFRPNGVLGDEAGRVMTLQVVRGPLLSEVRQVFASWATLTTRLWKGAAHAEQEWTVGPIPFEDSRGREVVLKYTTDLDSGKVFYTDANGREYQKRTRDFRPSWNLSVTEPIAGNYYPLTAGIYIEQTGHAALSLLTDRAQGGSSLQNGSLEVMVHRRLFLDDWRGVAEPLNETMCGCRDCDCGGLIARGTFYLSLEDAKEAPRARRSLQQRLNDPLILAVGPPADDDIIARSTSSDSLVGDSSLPPAGLRWSGLRDGKELPENVHLLTLMPDDANEGCVIVRLAHLYQVDEHEELSQPAEVDLAALFPGAAISAIEELSLSTNQRRADMSRLAFKAGPLLPDERAAMAAGAVQMDSLSSFAERLAVRVGAGAEAVSCLGAECGEADSKVVLRPMEIRTFQIALK